jgi:beta-carotene 3-hydroxylase
MLNIALTYYNMIIKTLLWIAVFSSTFLIMEFMAWFTHKYIMHGFLWNLHKDHHHKDHDSWFERNDAFFYLLCCS